MTYSWLQLRHIFSGKFIHVNLMKTSNHEKGKFRVCLLGFNGESAQFKILPKYKVSAEGEPVSIQRWSEFIHLHSATYP